MINKYAEYGGPIFRIEFQHVACDQVRLDVA